MKSGNSIIIFLLTFLIITSSISCGNDTSSIHVKNWKILYEQDSTLVSVLQKSGWEPVGIPLTVKLPYPPACDFQYIWLKGEFEIKDDPSIYYGLSTGRVRLADKIFINNYQIGSLLPEKVNWNPVPRNYIIPGGIIKKGNNEVYIQLGIYGYDHCGISGEVLIQTKKTFERAELSSNLVYHQLPFGIMFLFSALVIIFFISFLYDRKEKLNLYTALIMLTCNIYIFTSLPSYKLISFELFYGIICSVPFTISVLLILVFQTICRIYLSFLNRVIIPMLIVLIIFILISSSSLSFHLIFGILKYLYPIIIISIFAFMIYRLNSINILSSKKLDKFLLNTITSILVIFGVILILETYFYIAGEHYTYLIATFVSPVFVIFWGIFIPREIMNRRIEIELLYDKLKRIEGHERDLSITDSSELKLKRVIDFIDENFTSDISREGLAAAVDINPNYMGSLFKSYTGKTILEYINELRIDEAIRQLESGNLKIIDIAFSIGFENTVTFNRVFKRVTGKTPSDYKSNSIIERSNKS